MLVLLSTGAAGAQSYPPDVVAVLAGENKAAAELTFVGRSGQLYYPNQDSWRRKHLGGLASDVLGAVRAGSKLYAVCKRAPIFELEAGVWRVTPLANRGSSTFSADGRMTMAAVGRHLYELKGSKWSRFATASRRVTAIYATGTKSVYLATTRGRLRRTDGTRFTIIKNPLPATDYVLQLLGSSNGSVYGISKEGVVLHISSSTAKPITFADRLAGFQPQAMGLGQAGQLLLAGQIAGTDGSRRSALVELVGDQPKWSADLWPLAPGDRFSVIHRAADKAQVIATYAGVVRIRHGQEAWQERKVSGQVPPSTAAAIDGRRRPAQSQ